MYSAPVYAKLGSPCAKEAVCYTSSVSIPLAIAAITLSAASMIVLSAATVFARKAGKAARGNVTAKGAAGEVPLGSHSARTRLVHLAPGSHHG
jgi:hypothetical protein